LFYASRYIKWDEFLPTQNNNSNSNQYLNLNDSGRCTAILSDLPSKCRRSNCLLLKLKNIIMKLYLLMMWNLIYYLGNKQERNVRYQGASSPAYVGSNTLMLICKQSKREMRKDGLLLRLRTNLINNRTRVFDEMHSLHDKFNVRFTWSNIFGKDGNAKGSENNCLWIDNFA
jgi:hypothetical protein